MSNDTKKKSNKNKRVRRPREESMTPIHISENEFILLSAYLNIISSNLATHLKNELSYRLVAVTCPSIKISNIESSDIDGSSKLENLVTAVYIEAVSAKEVKDIFLKFAKENRYLNITITDTSIKIENSDKYQYFNIQMDIIGKDAAHFKIYSRRYFKVDGEIKKKRLFKNILKL